MAREGDGDPILLAGLPDSPRGLIEAITAVAQADFGVPTKEALFFAKRIFVSFSHRQGPLRRGAEDFLCQLKPPCIVDV